ncbi:hypothetical protein ACHWQZ_G002004 [Mnemiopsis leidyi]
MLYKNINVVVLLLSVCYLPTYCLDYMPHTAIDNVPAVLGQPLQIRCTKILEVSQYDYTDSVDCGDSWNHENCQHVWTKGGVELSPGSKYSMKSSITYDYCETFEWTSDLIRKLNVDVAENDASYYKKNDMKCFSSALTILDVTKADLGEYKCLLNIDNKRYSTDNQTIRVYNAASQEQMPKKIEYFQRFYTKGIISKMLMQCVVTGGPIYWFIRFLTDDCSRWYDDMSKCVNETIQSMDDIDKNDLWRSFNLTIDNHHPYNSNQITESFIYFQKIGSMDWAGLYCSTDPLGKVRSEVAEIVLKNDWSWWWNADGTRKILGYFVMPIIFSIFILAGAIIACYRGDICNCCGRQGLPYRYQAAIQPAYPQTFHYAIPTQAQFAPLAQPQANFT